MITKGSNDYKKAQVLANRIKKYADQTMTSRDYYELFSNDLDKYLEGIMKVGGFAAKVAETVSESMFCHKFCVAKVSDKQAWILACAGVEANIELN